MATAYTVTFSSAVGPKAPAYFDTTASQPTGALQTGLGIVAGADGAALTGAVYIGGAVAPIKADTDGNPNNP